MNLVIGNQIYDLENGIGLLKTLYQNDYNDLDEDLKDPIIEELWDKYQGIPKKLYIMSESKDPETLELCVKMLDEKGIKNYTEFHNAWENGGITKKLYRVKVFLNEYDKMYKCYK